MLDKLNFKKRIKGDHHIYSKNDIEEIIKLFEEDGWYLITTKGSHRQYKHPVKTGKTKRLRYIKMQKFLIIIEKAGSNYSAYSPDMPGCVATGSTIDETEKNMFEAIELHIEGLKEDNLPIPESTAIAEYLVVQ